MMKKMMKKATAGLLTAVCCLSLTMTAAAAATSSKAAGSYGTLTGSLSGTRAKVTSVTSVRTNPDNAYLTVTLDAKNSTGANLHSTGLRKSVNRGIVKYTFNWTNLNSKATSVYGTQGVQGGTKYSAAAVYTNTRL